jgi:hypothetical protein
MSSESVATQPRFQSWIWFNSLTNMSIRFGTLCTMIVREIVWKSSRIIVLCDARLDAIRMFIGSNSSGLILARFVSGFPFKRSTIHADRTAGEREIAREMSQLSERLYSPLHSSNHAPLINSMSVIRIDILSPIFSHRCKSHSICHLWHWLLLCGSERVAQLKDMIVRAIATWSSHPQTWMRFETIWKYWK